MRLLPLLLLLASCSAAPRVPVQPAPVVYTVPDGITPLTVEQDRDMRR